MSDLTEETGKRLADELKRLADILDAQPEIMPRLVERPKRFDPNACYHCGERHGGLACLGMSPTAIRY